MILCISVQQSSFYGYTSMLPSRYTQAVMTGESASIFWLVTFWLACLILTQFSPHSTCSSRHVSTWHDKFDVLSASRRACRAVLFDKLDTAKMHGLDTSNVSSRVETWRDVTSQVEFGLFAVTRIYTSLVFAFNRWLFLGCWTADSGCLDVCGDSYF